MEGQIKIIDDGQEDQNGDKDNAGQQEVDSHAAFSCSIG
jgi:hypothetical protein